MSHCPPTTFFLDVGLVAREGGHLHVDVLEGDRVDGARDAVDVGRVRHRLSEDCLMVEFTKFGFGMTQIIEFYFRGERELISDKFTMPFDNRFEPIVQICPNKIKNIVKLIKIYLKNLNKQTNAELD